MAVGVGFEPNIGKLKEKNLEDDMVIDRENEYLVKPKKAPSRGHFVTVL
jgi:hypothetical protein